jgi:transposase
MMERKRPRRRWSKDEKRAIVEEAEFPDASVAEVALRHEINANLLFRWRQEYRAEAETVEAKAGEEVSVQDAPEKPSLEFVPYSGHLFLFRSKRGDYLKIIYWDGTGLCLFAKKLEQGRFVWPKIVDGALTLSPAQLSLLIEGIDWRRTVSPDQPSRPKIL